MIVTRKVRIAAAAGGAAAVAGTIVLITASATGVQFGLPAAAHPSPSPSPTSGDVCSIFQAHLAHDLGKSQAQVDQALSQALQQTLADEVAAGKLTPKQADALRSKLGANPGCPALGSKKPASPALPTVGASVIAQALGISPKELESDMAQGQTVAQIAAAKGITEDQFRTNLINALQSKLDAMVKSGQLTQADEDAFLQKLRTGPIPYWNRTPARAPKTTSTPSPQAA